MAGRGQVRDVPILFNCQRRQTMNHVSLLLLPNYLGQMSTNVFLFIGIFF